MSDHNLSAKPVRLLTPQETAAFLSVSVRTVQRLVSAGDLHAVRISQSMRFRMDDLLNLYTGTIGHEGSVYTRLSHSVHAW